MSEKKDFTQNREKITFIDLFAGAGGISEGFLESYTDNKYFDFLLASDINTNCQLTHEVRYNQQLGLKTKFLCQDIMDDSFLSNLKAQLGKQVVDVVTGGPSCQSFSLAGNRKKFDKRDDLFYHYLKVIKTLRPKYFIMENVKGILTKDGGHIKDRILSEIRSIIDEKEIPALIRFVNGVYNKTSTPFLCKIVIAKLNFETTEDNSVFDKIGDFFLILEEQFKTITKDIAYKQSKSDVDINTIRHGLQLLKSKAEREKIRRSIINLKTVCNINNDKHVDNINSFIEAINDNAIVDCINNSLEAIKHLTSQISEIKEMQYALKIYSMTFDDCMNEISEHFKFTDKKAQGKLDNLMKSIRLYNIERPIVVLSSNYGVPQNRERVLFIGCRKDQEIIEEIPSTVSEEEKVTVYEAIWDLDTIGNGETGTNYKKIKPLKKFANLLIKRDIFSHPSANGELFSEWSKTGRLNHRFIFETEPFYVKTLQDIANEDMHVKMELFNHQTSLQNKDVRERLKIIAQCGDYDANTKKILKSKGLDSDKRNYTVLNACGQSPTVVTMPDDFIHYNSYRPLTVREMARLQTFDDNFILQGKRQTGGEKRKEEIPQYTLVGNAVPPLMARAIGNVILSKIK
jgi:DNA (cytosine-5)-methyltransferase 1